MAERERLPVRRAYEVLEFEHMGLRCRSGLGRYADLRVAEIFLSIAKEGSTAEVNARNSAITTSLALQHGCDVQIRRASTRNRDGSAARLLGQLLDLLATADRGRPTTPRNLAAIPSSIIFLPPARRSLTRAAWRRARYIRGPSCSCVETPT